MRDVSLQRIVEFDSRAARADAQSPGGLARRQAGAAGAGVDESFDARDGGIGDLAAAAGARIDQPLPAQSVQRAVIGVMARMLVNNLPVPFHAAGIQRFEDVVRGAGY